jgi:hypothetical protein
VKGIVFSNAEAPAANASEVVSAARVLPSTSRIFIVYPFILQRAP